MSGSGFTIFETAIGSCGIAWSEFGVVAVQLPEESAELTRGRLHDRLPGLSESEPPPEIAAAIAAIVALLTGKAPDLRTIALDLEAVTDFNRRVYAVARTIPPGSTLTYGDIAHRLGDLSLSRAVGQALGHNPFPLIVPCHRVLAHGNALGGFSAHGGATTKQRLLEIEGWTERALPLFGGEGIG
jgi:methylated-DNA-[protein]-cysteine S-methyltransferase